MSMELRMTTDLDYALPAEIGFNFEELKEELAYRLEYYEGLVVTEDTIKESKDDRAKLNKLKGAIEDRRKAIKKQWNAPYVEFEGKVKELVALIDRPIAAIDGQLASFEEKRKDEKRQEIEEAYANIVSDTIKDIMPLDRIFDKKWLNSTMSMTKVEDEIIVWSKRVNADLLALDTIEEEYKAAVREVYVRTLDIESAMAHRKSLKAAAEAFRAAEEARQAEQEAPAQEAVQPVIAHAEPEPEAQEIERMYRLRLELHLTMKQANALKKFLAENNIDYEKI